VPPGIAAAELVPGGNMPTASVKISFPRPVTADSFEDRDLHAGQQHVPLAGLRLPAGTPGQ